MQPRVRPILNRLWRVSRSSSIVLAALGIIGLLLAPRLIDRYIKYVEHEANKYRITTYEKVTAFSVDDRLGRRFGWLDVRYPRSILENESRPVDITYNIAPNVAWQRQADWQVDRSSFPKRAIKSSSQTEYPQLRIELTGIELTLAPEPLQYSFDRLLMMEQGSDDNRWVMSPTREGNYHLVIRFHVSPATFKISQVSVNGKLVPGKKTMLLPVTVYTRYHVPKLTVDIAKGAATVVAFALTFPAGTVLWDYVQKARRTPRAPEKKSRKK